MNILISQNKKIQLLFKIYYLIFLLIVLSVLTSLIFTNNFYQKSVRMENTSVNTDEKDLTIYYISELHTAKSLQQNKFIHDFQIDHIRETKVIPNLKVVKLPRDLRSINSTKSRKELFIKITLPLIVQENNKLLSLNKKINFLNHKF